MNSKWFLALISSVFLLAGCADGYRYPCQDPDNWEKKECKKPWCSANGTCPEDLTHYEKSNSQQRPTMPAPVINTGGCK